MNCRDFIQTSFILNLCVCTGCATKTDFIADCKLGLLSFFLACLQNTSHLIHKPCIIYYKKNNSIISVKTKLIPNHLLNMNSFKNNISSSKSFYTKDNNLLCNIFEFLYTIEISINFDFLILQENNIIFLVDVIYT